MIKNNPIRLLYVNGGLMNRGGIESYMMNYYRNFDHEKIQIDFIVHNAGGCGYYDDEIKKLGGNIYVVPQKSKHPLTYPSNLKKIFKNNNYKIIHTHMDAMSTWVLKIAKECEIPVRIAHSHNTQHLTTNPIKLFFLEQARKKINLYATHRMACSEAAGNWLFGNAPYQIIKNAIDLDNFIFSPASRENVRKEWGIKENEFLIGHVGRFDTQKNHVFLIDCFYKIHQKLPNTKLMLIGEGILMPNIKDKVEKLGLKDCIVFTGSRNDANRFYNAFDLFVLPSLFEGLGIVAIEAEINGCTTFLSDNTPQDARIAHNVSFLPLDIDVWTEKVIKYILKKNTRQGALFDIYNSGYDIKTEAQKLQNIYLDLWKSY